MSPPRFPGVPRPLSVLATAMEALVHDTDVERAHAAADELLVEALNTLSILPDTRAAVTILVEAYERVDRWFA